MGSESTAIDAAIAANATIAAFQPKPLMSDWPSGASTSVPSDPAAATRPTVWLRFSGGVARDTVPMSTPKPVPAVPMPARKPAARFKHIAPSDAPAREQILGAFDRLERMFADGSFRGCPYVNAVTEIGDPGHVAASIAVQFKEQRRLWFRALLERLGVRDADALAT